MTWPQDADALDDAAFGQTDRDLSDERPLAGRGRLNRDGRSGLRLRSGSALREVSPKCIFLLRWVAVENRRQHRALAVFEHGGHRRARMGPLRVLEEAVEPVAADAAEGPCQVRPGGAGI